LRYLTVLVLLLAAFAVPKVPFTHQITPAAPSGFFDGN
jgi:hypothetical protein